MICVSCGKDVEKNAKFCPYCGLAVLITKKVKSVKKETAKTDVAEQPPLGIIKTFSKKNKIRLSIAVILMCVTGLLIFVLSKGNFREIRDNNDWFNEGMIDKNEQTALTKAEDLFDRGKMFYDREDYETAITDFSEALSLDPNIAKAYRLRGISLLSAASGTSNEKSQTYDKAIADLTQAIRLEPNNAEAYAFRGLVYIHKDDIDKGISDFTQAIRLDSNYYQAYWARGQLYALNEEYNHAIEDFEAALKIKPDYNDAKQRLVQARRARGY
jgi:tetratricopeptide (TPR) repeat protein/DNA-directed RNA polymerase subunit RPC12/RpoP